jgi:hypothetical protein
LFGLPLPAADAQTLAFGEISLDYSKIHWHDSLIKKVIEIPSEERLLFEVDYPVDWEIQIWEPHTIEFEDLYTYEIHEGPLAGSPTILDATKLDIYEYGIITLWPSQSVGDR